MKRSVMTNVGILWGRTDDWLWWFEPEGDRVVVMRRGGDAAYECYDGVWCGAHEEIHGELKFSTGNADEAIGWLSGEAAAEEVTWH